MVCCFGFFFVLAAAFYSTISRTGLIINSVLLVLQKPCIKSHLNLNIAICTSAPAEQEKYCSVVQWKECKKSWKSLRFCDHTDVSSELFFPTEGNFPPASFKLK